MDFAHNVDYIHYNPVKHGLVTRVKDWPYSTLHRYVDAGVYPPDWGGEGLDWDQDYGE
jgi:putative transposase